MKSIPKSKIQNECIHLQIYILVHTYIYYTLLSWLNKSLDGYLLLRFTLLDYQHNPVPPN